jgi:hypothetical protein
MTARLAIPIAIAQPAPPELTLGGGAEEAEEVIDIETAVVGVDEIHGVVNCGGDGHSGLPPTENPGGPLTVGRAVHSDGSACGAANEPDEPDLPKMRIATAPNPTTTTAVVAPIKSSVFRDIPSMEAFGRPTRPPLRSTSTKCALRTTGATFSVVTSRLSESASPACTAASMRRSVAATAGHRSAGNLSCTTSSIVRRVSSTKSAGSAPAMSGNPTRAKPISLSISKRACLESMPLTATGTGFFYRVDGKDFILTARHNLTGRHWETNEFLSPAHQVEPTHIRVTMRSAPPKGGWSTTVGSNIMAIPMHQYLIPLIDDEWKPIWLQHPELGAAMDVAAIPFPNARDQPIEILAWDDTVVTTPDPAISRLWVTQDLSIPGYPSGLVSAPGLPIWIRGSVASDPTSCTSTRASPSPPF